ncbi:MAG: hypothetical protein HZC36_03025 [Armatimonadetes bacterium]|nr:hypothetical protein [Armatimonadota bacterium]
MNCTLSDSPWVARRNLKAHSLLPPGQEDDKFQVDAVPTVRGDVHSSP